MADLFWCQPTLVGANSSEGKDCTRCHEWKPYSDFHKNKDKSGGRDSLCKTCVSKRKARRRDSVRALKAKLRKKCAGFSSTVHGEIAAVQLDVFADVLGAAIKEIFDDA